MSDDWGYDDWRFQYDLLKKELANKDKFIEALRKDYIEALERNQKIIESSIQASASLKTENIELRSRLDELNNAYILLVNRVHFSEVQDDTH